MEVAIRRVDPEVAIPEYKTSGSAAMDCYARVEVTIPAGGIGYVPLNFSLKPPPGHFVLLAARSSLHKRGLVMPNGVGVFDEDYSGDEDEYMAILHNISEIPVTVERGDRLVQIIVLPYDRVELSEKATLGSPNRGGIGSTGIR